MSSPGVSSSALSRRQKRMGPAPFASFEDLSDEVRSHLDSPDDKNSSVIRLPGIREDLTPNEQPTPEFIYTGISLVGAPVTPPSTEVSTISTQESQTSTRMSLQTPSTPRIDISRASSSSHHDSRDSTPERELFEGHEPASAKLGLGFREEGTLDLRSSTEELDFQDPQDKAKIKVRSQSPRPDDSHSLHQRKDSQSSEIGLLSISGRTSRLSSIGSQGSAQSRLSNASHLSIISGQSGMSRSPSPHKMLVETSFCGNKPPRSAHAGAQRGAKVESDLEKVLLARKHDPTQAILAEGIDYKKKQDNGKKSERSDIKITVDKPSAHEGNNVPKLSKTFVSESGIEYTYIPLRGPLPKDESKPNQPRRSQRVSTTLPTANALPLNNKPRSVEPSSSVPKPGAEPKYIRIKLKPDHMYKDEGGGAPTQDVQKPLSLNLVETSKELPRIRKEAEPVSANVKAAEQSKNLSSISSTPNASPKLSRHNFLKEVNVGSKTPSPSLSRKSSFCSLFRSKEAIISPESPTVTKRKNTLTSLFRDDGDRSRSRSKSRDRDKSSSLSGAPSSTESIDSKTKQKSVFSIFKPRKSSSKSKVEEPEIVATYETPKKYYENPLEGGSIRIPLHSPQYEDRIILQDLKSSSQDSQETVIEVAPKSCEVKCEPVIPEVEDKKIDHNFRQSSTSSENVEFTTKLGSNNEIFTTKLPKEQKQTDSDNKNEIQVDIPKEEDKINPVATQETNLVKEPKLGKSRNSVLSSLADEDRNSSESERDSEVDYLKTKQDSEEKSDSYEPERKGLVFQDSFEDELPYVPTTLPLERSVAVPIVPVKQRSTMEIKTFPIDRPRSTTPINPSTLDDYCEDVIEAINAEKLKISLPHLDDSQGRCKLKSPRKVGKNWFEFAEKGINLQRRSSQDNDTPSPPPQTSKQTEWINFEEIPEKRKAPKRIQTIPSRGLIEVADNVQENVVYSYVNPEDCKCECHEINARQVKLQNPASVQEDELPLLADEHGEEEKIVSEVDHTKLEVATSDRRSVISDSSIDLSASIDHADTNSTELPLRMPFTSDLGVSSNRSSVVSQEEPPSPQLPSPNAFQKNS